MTAEEKTTLDKYQQEYDTALAAYNTEKANRAVFQDGADRSWATGTWIYGPSGVANDTNWWISMLNASVKSEQIKKQVADAALQKLNDYKTQINKNASQQFAANNPGAVAEILKNELSAVTVQKTTKYLIWGTVALVVVAIVVYAFKSQFTAK